MIAKKNVVANDERCIWMTAGVVNYKLCEMQFQCEHCDFHKVMCGIMPLEAESIAVSEPCGCNRIDDQLDENEPVVPLIHQYLRSLFANYRIYLDRYYFANHFWGRPVGNGQIEIGISPLSFKILAPVDQVIPPQTGQMYRNHQLIALLIRKGRTIPLYTPFEGVVTAVNPALAARGFEELIHHDEHLFVMDAGKNFHFPEQYGNTRGLEWHKDMVGHLKQTLAKELGNMALQQVGVTMADGGEVQTDLENVIGKAAFDELVKTLF